jgi:hypothetical protein
MGVGIVVGVSPAGEASVGAVAVGKGKGVSVGRRAGDVGVGEEQEIRRKIQRAESRMRDVRCWGMQAILTEIIFLNKCSRSCSLRY